MVVTLTEDDRRMLQRAIPDVVTAVVPSAFPVAHDAPTSSQRIPRSILFVGGFRHVPNVDAMLFFCGEVLPLLRQALPGVTVTIVGSAPPLIGRAMPRAMRSGSRPGSRRPARPRRW
jgi:hypothetical protein